MKGHTQVAVVISSRGRWTGLKRGVALRVERKMDGKVLALEGNLWLWR